jgi:hypothetical protein
MRATTPLLGVLVLAAGGVIFWQRSQIASLRSQVGDQGAALAGERERLDELASRLDSAPSPRLPALRASFVRAPESSATLRADERRVILGQYRDVLAQAGLPEATASRLQDLLADRVEAFLDAQDAARREGFAEGSADMERAIALAIADDDRQISELLSLNANGRLNAPPAPSPVEPWVAPAPAAPAVVVTVVNQAPAEAPAADLAAEAPGPYGAGAYLPYYYYPPVGYFAVGGLSRPFESRPGLQRPHRSPVAPRVRRG